MTQPLTRASLVWALAVGLVVARPARCQTFGPDTTPRWVGHFTVLAGNATIGALTGGLIQALRGGSFRDGFARGALGGAVGYVGKRIVVRDFWGAGLLGRELNAVGVSMVRNAAEGRPSLSRLFLPLGPAPVRLTLEFHDGVRARPQLDVTSAAWLVYGLVESRFTFDLDQSLSMGTAVFHADRRRILDEGKTLGGFAAARLVFLSDSLAFYPTSGSWAHVRSHERVHVLQQDFVLTAWSDPLASHLVGRLPFGPTVNRYATIDSFDWVLGVVKRILYTPATEEHYPIELEAEFLSKR